jgi:endoglucanase
MECGMNFENKNFLFNTFGVSGREEAVRSAIKAFAEPFVEEVFLDTTGSLICKKGGAGSKRIMITAHMDTIGFIVTHIDERGFLRFSEVGGQPAAYIAGRRVIFENGEIGVIGVEKLEKGKSPSKDRMFIDIGVQCSVEAKKRVSVGDMCSVFAPFAITDTIATGGWLDNRIGCFVLLEVMETLKKNRNDVYFVFSAQEEVGLRGATTTAYALQPHIGLAVDVTPTSDTPEGERIGSSELGKGTAVKFMDRSVIVPKKLTRHLAALAQGRDIAYQHDVIRHGGTDAHAMQLSRGGVLAGGISIPTRYIHSSAEMCALGDIQATIDLVRAVCQDDMDI